MLQGFQQNFPAPQTPIVDPTTGAFSKDGRYFLLALWSRTGQGPGLPSVAPALIAAAGVPVNIAKDWNAFVQVDPTGIGIAGGVAILPALSVGASVAILNAGANALMVQPQANAQIDALGLGAGYSLAAGKMQIFSVWTPTQLYSMQLG